MNEKIWQCCYTNAESREEGVLQTGWGAVSYSDDIPQEVLNQSISFQNANAHINPSDIYSGDGHISVLEYFGNNDYLFVMNSKYGLMDHAGRANMFSHGYIMPWDESTVMDPASFLTITDNNFSTTVEDAEIKKNNLHNLERKGSLTLEAALKETGIGRDEYAILIRCVFIQFSNTQLFRPLYVQYDGSTETMRKVLYCIYTGIPFGMRKRLKAASCKGSNSEKTNIIFSRETYKTDCYIDPVTGENNVITDNEIEIINGLRFVDYAVTHYTGEKDINEYFRRLDETAASFGDETGCDENICRLSHYMNNEEELHSLTTDGLQELVDIIFGNTNTKEARVQSALAEILTIFKEREKGLYSDNEQRLINLLNGGSTSVLGETAHEYFICRLETLPTERAEKLLGMFSDEDAEFYRGYMTKDSEVMAEGSEEESEESHGHTETVSDEEAAGEEYSAGEKPVSGTSEEAVVSDERGLNKEEAAFEEQQIKKDDPGKNEKLYAAVQGHITEMRNEFPECTDDEIFEYIKIIFGEISGEDITEDDDPSAGDTFNDPSGNENRESGEKREVFYENEGLKTEADPQEATAAVGFNDAELQKIIADGKVEADNIKEGEQLFYEEKIHNEMLDKKAEKARQKQERKDRIKEEKDRQKEEKDRQKEEKYRMKQEKKNRKKK